MNNNVAVLCAKVSEMPDPGVEGTIQKNCSRCQEPVWVSPSTVKVIEEKAGRTDLFCLDCHLLCGRTVNVAEHDFRRPNGPSMNTSIFISMLAVALIVLKLAHVIVWGWGWVLMPIWAPILLLAAVFLALLLANANKKL